MKRFNALILSRYGQVIAIAGVAPRHEAADESRLISVETGQATLSGEMMWTLIFTSSTHLTRQCPYAPDRRDDRTTLITRPRSDQSLNDSDGMS